MKLDILYLADFFIFPGEKVSINAKGQMIIDLLNKAASLEKPVIGILPAVHDPPGFLDHIGILCFIEKNKIEDVKHNNENIRIFPVVGQQRFRILKILQFTEISGSSCPVLAEVESIEDEKINQKSLGEKFLSKMKRVLKELRTFVPASAGIPSPQKIARWEPGKIADLLSPLAFPLNDFARWEFLENPDTVSRLKKIVDLWWEILELGKKETAADPKTAFGNPSGDCVDELSGLGKVDQLKERFEKVKDKMSSEGRKNIADELSRLSAMEPGNEFFSVSYNYVAHVLDLFGLEPTKDCDNLRQLRKILDDDHFGLEKVKDRLEEDVAVRIMNPNQKAPILCFVGPPGVGKTSLGKSIARALDKKFIRMSLGGLKDEAEIRGHRRTYIGAIPGRIINAIKNSGSLNPVFMMDEVDKIGLDFRGDPAAALLEALDPEQNHSFVDHYTEVPFDLSKVYFILTANTTDPVPPALRDRLEIIRLPGYTEEEKLGIAKNFLVPKQLAEKGLKDKVETKFEDGALLKIIREYTDEAGVRNLERAIADVCRKISHRIVSAGGISGCEKFFTVSADSLLQYLGPQKHFFEEATKDEKFGVVNGLAWTEHGGIILQIEAEIIEKGKGQLILTGSLGAVMKESAQVALSLLRSGKHSDMEKKIRNDIHLHAPEGAVPKEGPSAGLAFYLCLYSFVKRMPIKSTLGVTGEISLKRRVLPVGGIREKILGADRAGVTEVILPKKNGSDLTDLPPSLKKKIEAGEFKIHLVSSVDEALDIAFPQRADQKAEKK